MSASWFLNVFGLIVSTIAAAIMFYYPPRGRAFTEEGAEAGSWINNPKPEYAELGKRQTILGKFDPPCWGLDFCSNYQQPSLMTALERRPGSRGDITAAAQSKRVCGRPGAAKENLWN